MLPPMKCCHHACSFAYAGATHNECTTAAPPPSGKLLPVDQRIEADWKGYGTWYQGRITKAHADDTYDLLYDDDDTETKVTRKRIRYAIDAKDAWCMAESGNKWGNCKCGPCDHTRRLFLARACTALAPALSALGPRATAAPTAPSEPSVRAEDAENPTHSPMSFCCRECSMRQGREGLRTHVRPVREGPDQCRRGRRLRRRHSMRWWVAGTRRWTGLARFGCSLHPLDYEWRRLSTPACNGRCAPLPLTMPHPPRCFQSVCATSGCTARTVRATSAARPRPSRAGRVSSGQHPSSLACRASGQWQDCG